MNTFEQALREQLREAEHNLDDPVAQQLVNARRQAMSARRQFHLPRFMVPALGMVTASVVALILVVAPVDDNQQRQSGMERLTPENAEFYENLDFFYWLAESDAAKRS